MKRASTSTLEEQRTDPDFVCTNHAGATNTNEFVEAGEQDIEISLATNRREIITTSTSSILDHQQQDQGLTITTSSSAPSCCARHAAIALEQTADSFATKKSWVLARKMYSQALQIITRRIPVVVDFSNQVAVDTDGGNHAAAELALAPCSPCSIPPSLAAAGHVLQHSSAAAFRILQKISNACIELKDFRRALDAQKQCLDIICPSSTSCTSPTSIADIPQICEPRLVTVLDNMGCIHFSKGDIPTAIVLYKKCLLFQRSTLVTPERDLLVEANTISNMGCIYRQAGRFDNAIDCHDNALELRTKVLGEDHISLSHDLIAIGDIHYCQMQFDLSLAAFSECMSLNHTNLVDSSSTGIDLGILASVSYKMGEACVHLEDRLNAKECYEDAVDMARSEISNAGDNIAMEPAPCNKNTALMTKCLYNLAAIHRSEGSICKAIDCAEESLQLGLLELSSTLMRNESACSILSFMMRLYQDKGDSAKVQMYSQRIAELEINADVEGGCASWRKKRSKLSAARAA